MTSLTLRLDSRGYDLDARQRVSPGALARYLEHVRWKVLADPSTGLPVLFEADRKLVVRAQALRFAAPLVRDKHIDIMVELSHVGRTSLKFLQRATQVDDGACVAEALVAVVSLDAGGKPSPVPESVRRGLAPPTLAELATPALGPRPREACWSVSLPVRPSDLDTQRHLNQSRYVDCVDDVRELFARSGARTDVRPSAGSYPRGIYLEYAREVLLGQNLRAFAWPLDGGALGVELSDDANDQVVARARIDGASST